MLLYDLESLQYDAAMLRRALPRNLSKERRAVVERALSLAGKVNYFWGGKSLVFGWDNRWGQLAKVTAGRQLHHRHLPALRVRLQWMCDTFLTEKVRRETKNKD